MIHVSKCSYSQAGNSERPTAELLEGRSAAFCSEGIHRNRASIPMAIVVARIHSLESAALQSRPSLEQPCEVAVSQHHPQLKACRAASSCRTRPADTKLLLQRSATSCQSHSSSSSLSRISLIVILQTIETMPSLLKQAPCAVEQRPAAKEKRPVHIQLRQSTASRKLSVTNRRRVRRKRPQPPQSHRAGSGRGRRGRFSQHTPSLVGTVGGPPVPWQTGPSSSMAPWGPPRLP